MIIIIIIIISAECKMLLAQAQYKNWRHNKVAQVIHWDLCRKYKLPVKEKWYEHRAENVSENDNVKILWDVKIQTDKIVEHSRPDILVVIKETKKCLIIDVACPFDTRIKEKEKEKVEKYQDLKREIKRIWQCKEVTIIPIIIGTLGTVNTNFKLWLKKLELKLSFRTMQKVCLLGSARIVRKVLDT